MALSMGEHAKIDAYINEKNDEKIQELKAEALEELEEVRFWKNTGMPAKKTKKEIELMIELVVKIEAYEQGKGWLFRTKRRTALIMEYT